MYILGTNLERGRKAAEEQGPNVIFHQCNVSKYQDLAATFHKVHTKYGRVDCVFANAGATESCDILGNRQQGPAGEGIPAVPDLTVVDVNFNGVLYTSYLAMYYFRFSPGAGKGASLVITGSCGSLYPFKVIPMYAATKRAFRFPLSPHLLLLTDTSIRWRPWLYAVHCRKLLGRGNPRQRPLSRNRAYRACFGRILGHV